MSLKSFIGPLISIPHEDSSTATKLHALNILLLSMWCLLILLNVAFVIHIFRDSEAVYGWTTAFEALFMCILVCVSYMFSIRGHLKIAVWILLLTMIVGAAVGQYARGENYVIILIYPLTIFTAGLLLGPGSAIACFIMASIAYSVTIQFLHEWGPFLETNQTTMDIINHLVLVSSLIAVLVLTWMFSRNMQRYIENLEASNREKEILLREIHHRVKNNLQIVSSLLNLQGESLTDENSKKVFENSVSRIKSMALVHEKLYRSDNFSKIILRDYIGSLLDYLGQSYKTTPDISIESDIDGTELDIETSLSVGIIINELVTNSIKHAFKDLPPDANPKITVKFQSRASHMRLTVADNGCGMVRADGAIKSKSLGMPLIAALLDELGGTMDINTSSGTEIQIKFEYVGG